jgi:hypothetical protein
MVLSQTADVLVCFGAGACVASRAFRRGQGLLNGGPTGQVVRGKGRFESGEQGAVSSPDRRIHQPASGQCRGRPRRARWVTDAARQMI